MKREKKIKVIIINATERTITEGVVTGLESCQKIVGGLIAVATELPNGDEVFVNDEGLLNGPQAFFDIGAHQEFAGDGYVIGPCNRNGYSTDVRSTVEEIKAKVEFMDHHDMATRYGKTRPPEKGA